MVGRGDLFELDTIIAKLKTGEVSDLVPTEAGFHILKKTDEEPGKPLSFDEVKDRIRISLELRQKNEFVTSYVDKLISQADIRYKDTSLVYVPPVDSGKNESFCSCKSALQAIERGFIKKWYQRSSLRLC